MPFYANHRIIDVYHNIFDSFSNFCAHVLNAMLGEKNVLLQLENINNFFMPKPLLSHLPLPYILFFDNNKTLFVKDLKVQKI